MHKDYEQKTRKHYDYKNNDGCRIRHHNSPKILRAQNQAIFENDRKNLKVEYKH